ncbi:MAG: hypothetical protein ACPG4T_04280 [Nannocystaceae bacterium]
MRLLSLLLVMQAACASTPNEPTRDIPAKGARVPESANNRADLKEAHPNAPAPESANSRSEISEAPPPGVKTNGNVLARTGSEQEAELSNREDCILDCVASRQMQAKRAEAIEADCSKLCHRQHPLVQAEDVPDQID